MTGPRRSLVARDVERLIRAMDARPPAAGRTGDRGTQGLADGLGISLHSLYNYWPGRVQWVSVDGWMIPLLVRPGQEPRMLDGARRVAP